MKLKTFVSLVLAGLMGLGMGYALADDSATMNSGSPTMSGTTGTNNDTSEMGVTNGSGSMGGTSGTDNGATPDTTTTDEDY